MDFTPDFGGQFTPAKFGKVTGFSTKGTVIQIKLRLNFNKSV